MKFFPENTLQQLEFDKIKDLIIAHSRNDYAKNRIQQLGPAFGTKWLSFISPSSQPAPIYDSFIAMWIEKFARKEFAQTSTSSEVWSKKTYSTYLEWMLSNSKEFGLKPDDLELIIFQDATQEFSTPARLLHQFVCDLTVQ